MDEIETEMEKWTSEVEVGGEVVVVVVVDEVEMEIAVWIIEPWKTIVEFDVGNVEELVFWEKVVVVVVVEFVWVDVVRIVDGEEGGEEEGGERQVERSAVSSSS